MGNENSSVLEIPVAIAILFASTLLLLLFLKTHHKAHAHTKKHSKTNIQYRSNNTVNDFPVIKIVYVIDGDTVLILKNKDKIKIRLDAIDCPEDGQEWGDIAKYGLMKILKNNIVKIEEHGTDYYSRTLATLYVKNKSNWMNVNERMVTLGHAWVMRKYYKHLSLERQTKLNQLERWAKAKKVGLWKTSNPIPPWQWRNSK